MLRGNHDDPEYFDKGLIDFPLMKTIPDYTVIHFQKTKILCLGGGISVDRFLHKQLMSNKDVKIYWDGEAPNFYLPKLEMISSEFRIDTNLENDLKDERRVMDNIYNFLKTNDHPLKEWYYGHSHDSRVSFIINQNFRY